MTATSAQVRIALNERTEGRTQTQAAEALAPEAVEVLHTRYEQTNPRVLRQEICDGIRDLWSVSKKHQRADRVG